MRHIRSKCEGQSVAWHHVFFGEGGQDRYSLRSWTSGVCHSVDIEASKKMGPEWVALKSPILWVSFGYHVRLWFYVSARKQDDISPMILVLWPMMNDITREYMFPKGLTTCLVACIIIDSIMISPWYHHDQHHDQHDPLIMVVISQPCYRALPGCQPPTFPSGGLRLWSTMRVTSRWPSWPLSFAVMAQLSTDKKRWLQLWFKWWQWWTYRK